MFIGHYGAAFAGKKFAPKISLGVFFAATLFIDLFWSIFSILGIEKFRVDPSLPGIMPVSLYYMPYSHSLSAAILWSTLFALLVYAFYRDTRGAVVSFLVVISHWILDLVAHREDLSIFGGPIKFGFGIWNWRWLALGVEFGVFFAGLLLYLSAAPPRDRTGTWSLASLVMLLIAAQMAIAFSPGQMLEELDWAVLSQFLLVFWAVWIDRHRVTEFTLPRTGSSAAAAAR